MQSDDPQEPADQTAPDDHKAWEVVEEVEEVADKELENLDSFGDNSPQLSEEPVTMSHSHDYVQQNLDQLETPPSSAGEYYHPPKSPRKIPYLLIGGIALGLIGLILAVKLIFFKSATETKPGAADILIESTSGSPSPSPTPTSTPAVQTDKADLKIQVLNGSGVVGAAGKLAQVLKNADYTNVDTGNASSYTAEGVKIQVKDSQDSLGDDLEKALKDDYEDITVKDNLDDDSDYDVVITLGKQPQEEKVQGASDSADLKQPSDKKD